MNARIVLCFIASVALAQSPKDAPKSAPDPLKSTEAPRSSAADNLNLLGSTNTQGGESRRNENVSFNLIDNNSLKELNIRMGTTATIVTEMQPQRHYYGVEFGNSPPSLLHLSSSKPAAAIHGMLFATHNNSVFSARSFFQVGSVQPARENQYGFQWTSPLWRKAFLSIDGSQQKTRGNVNGNVLVPLTEERSALTTDPAARALIERFFAAYPAALPNRPDIDRRALNTNAAQRINTDTAAFRIDQILSSRDKFILRHALTSQQVDAFQLVAGQNPDTTTKSHNSRLTWQRAWSARTVTDVTAGFDRVRSLLMPEPNAVGPQVQIGTAFTALGPNSNVPLDRVQNRFRAAAMASTQRGSHRIVAGGEVTRLRFNGREASSNRGNFYFRNDFGRDAITNFRLGLASRFSTGLGEIDRGFRNWEQHYYAGDTWQMSSRLTASLSVRYQPFLAPSEADGLTTIPYRCDCNNFGPRAGLAYRLPGQRGVLRAAYGLHYGELFPVTFQQLRWNPPRFQKIEAMAPDFLEPLKDASISPDGRSTIFVVPSDLKTPYSHQYNLSWEAALRSNWRVQLGWVGSRTHKLLMLWHRNRAIPVPGVPQTTVTINDRRPDPRFFELRTVENASRAYFDAARVTLVVPEYKNLSIDASYWFSKALDTGASYLNTAAGDDARQGYSQSEFLVQQDLKGPSAFDQSHASLIRLRYVTPGNARWSKWTASVVWLAKTGMPFTVISGSDGPGFGNTDGTNGDRPHLVDPSVLGRALKHPDTSVALLPRSAFRFMSPGESRGNLGVSTFRRGGIRNINASLSRTFALPNEQNVTFRAESVNFFNSPQFAEPNFDLTSPAFGKITNTLNDGRTFQFTLQWRF